jgi:hypothetical protein
MATAIAVEFDDQGRSQGAHRIQVPMYPAVTRQVVSFTTSTATSNAFDGKTTMVGIIADAKAHFAVAAAPTATANSEWIPADTWLFFGVEPGSGLKIAFYDGTS